MKIIEFYGPPGCGKSSVSHFTSELLRERGFSVNEPSYIVSRLKKRKRKISKVFIAVSFVILHFSRANKIIHFIKKNTLQTKRKRRETNKLLLNLFYVLSLETKKESCDFLIFDQGLIQALISLLIDSCGKERIETYYEMIISMFQIKPVNIRIDVEDEIVFQRIEGRKKKRDLKDINSRADQMDYNQLIKFIKDTSHLCEEIIKKPALVLDGRNTIEDLSLSVVNFLGNTENFN